MVQLYVDFEIMKILIYFFFLGLVLWLYFWGPSMAYKLQH
jgi:hypothetical protein